MSSPSLALLVKHLCLVSCVWYRGFQGGLALLVKNMRNFGGSISFITHFLGCKVLNYALYERRDEWYALIHRIRMLQLYAGLLLRLIHSHVRQ